MTPLPLSSSFPPSSHRLRHCFITPPSLQYGWIYDKQRNGRRAVDMDGYHNERICNRATASGYQRSLTDKIMIWYLFTIICLVYVIFFSLRKEMQYVVAISYYSLW